MLCFTSKQFRDCGQDLADAVANIDQVAAWSLGPGTELPDLNLKWIDFAVSERPHRDFIEETRLPAKLIESAS